jgi:hypothetical protein
MEKLGTILGALGLIFIACVIWAWPVQLLWNYSLVGSIDGINLITFWQALGISFLFNILFKATNSNKQ